MRIYKQTHFTVVAISVWPYPKTRLFLAPFCAESKAAAFLLMLDTEIEINWGTFMINNNHYFRALFICIYILHKINTSYNLLLKKRSHFQ